MIPAPKKRCQNAARTTREGGIPRAAIAVLAGLTDGYLVALVKRLRVIRAGRPARGAR